MAQADRDWDVIIVGARAAGAGLAIRFARSGRRVLVVERSSLGSDTLSSHGFAGMAMSQLDKLGVLDDVLATGAPRLTHFRMDVAGQVLAMPITNGYGYVLSVRRTALDPILVRHAAQMGATVRHGVAARGLLRDGERVTGVVIEDGSGRIEEHTARLVVGADGRHSHVAAWAGAGVYDAEGTRTSAIYGYYEGVRRADAAYDCMQFVFGEGMIAICGPSDGEVASVLVVFDNARFDEVRRAGTEAFVRCAASLPVLGEQLRDARLVSKLRPAGPRELDCHFKVPWGLGWALVGDAGYKEHPAAGRGIGNALRCGELLHRAVEDAWLEGKPTEAYLPRFHEERDAHMRPSRDFSMMQAGIKRPTGERFAEIGAAGAALAALDMATVAEPA